MNSLLDTIDAFKEHIGLNESVSANDFVKMQPDVLLAEDDYLRPALGAAFYDDLIDPSTTLTSAEADRLRALLRSALANLSMVGYLDMGQVQISGAGVQIISTDNQKTAFQWQVNNLKTSFSRKGWNGLEKALAYLEAHATDFPAWASSSSSSATIAGVYNSTMRSVPCTWCR